LAFDTLFKSKKSALGDTTKKRGQTTPIIIVPAALTSLITIFNVDGFLNKGLFKTTEEARKTSQAKYHDIKITHAHKSGASITYRIIDNPQSLKDRDWDSVVAVFASGQSWQFKGWRWEQPVDIFNNGNNANFIAHEYA
jgi:parafibromin